MASCLLVFFKPVNKDTSKCILKTKGTQYTRFCLASVLGASRTARHRPEHVEDDNDEDDDQQG